MERNAYKPLSMEKLREGASCPPSGGFSPKPVREDSPAIEAMTDLCRIDPATIASNATLLQANQAMIARGVRLLLVAGDGRKIEGLITARDTMGEKAVKHVKERGGRHGELTVSDLMVPRGSIEVLTLSAVKQAKVGHIIATLKEVGRQHALVVDEKDGIEVVCGVFSATQIGRQLGVPVLTFEVARTFSEIEAELSKA